MRTDYRRAIAALPEELAALHDGLAAFLAEAGLAPRTVHAVQLVCDELVGNAVRHGARGRDGKAHRIEVEVTLGERIAVRIRDDLPLFDPTAAPALAPRAGRTLETAAVGGRGLGLVRRYARAFRWHAEDGRNVVELEIEKS